MFFYIQASPTFDLSASSFKIAKSMFEKPKQKSKTLERQARPKPKPRSRSYTLGSRQRHKSPSKPLKDQYGVSVSIKDIKGKIQFSKKVYKLAGKIYTNLEFL